MEAQASITTTDVAKYVSLGALIIGLIMLVVMYIQYSKKVEGNPGPWKFNPAEYPIVLTGVQLNTIAKKSFTFSNYLYIDGVTEQRANPQTLWRWGINDPVRNSFATMIASYIPAEEKIRYDFANASTGDINKITSVDVPNINPHKWFHTAIAIEGRTIDIYVNGVHAKSVQLPNVLKQATDGIQMVGNSGILGKMALWSITESRLSEQEVLSQYKATSDNIGNPILPVDYSFIWKFPSFNLCPGMPWCEEVVGDCKTYVKYEYA